jgi:alkylhydroperoxidase family enzyme
MRQSPPRLPPIAPEQFTEEQAALVGAWSHLNFSRVIVRHPDLYRTLIPLIEKLIPGSSLPPRDREVLVLRTLALCEEVYEAHHHVLIARKAGMTDAEIEAARLGGADLTPFEQVLARAAEELVRNHRVGGGTWRELAQTYTPVQLMEATALVGGYVMVAMLTRSFDIPLESEAADFGRLAELRQYT